MQIYGLLEAGEKLHSGLSNLALDAKSSSDSNSILGTLFTAQAGEEMYSSKGQIALALAEDARSTYRQYCASLKQEVTRQTGIVHNMIKAIAEGITALSNASRTLASVDVEFTLS